MSRVYLRRPGLDVRINSAVDRSLDILLGRIAWSASTLAVVIACCWLAAAAL